MNLIFCFLILAVLSIEQYNYSINYIYEEIAEDSYSFEINTIYKLHYNGYPGVYSMDLLGFKEVNHTWTVQNRDDEYFQEFKNNKIEEDGCTAENQRISFNKNFEDFQYQNANNPVLSVVVAYNLNQTFIIRKDHTITEVYFEYNDQDQTYPLYSYGGVSKSFADIIKVEQGDYIRSFYDAYNQIVFIISDSEMIYFFANGGGLSDSEFKFYSLKGMDEYSKIKSVEYNEYLDSFLICTQTTVDFYSFLDSEEIVKLGNVDGYSSISDVKIHQKQQQVLLYVLDKEQGFFIYNITNINNGEIKELDFEIPIVRGVFFDMFGDTLLVVCETVYQEQYMIEFFLSIPENQYFVNNVYMNDLDVVDIQMFAHYALLTTSDTIYIIRHSIVRQYGYSSQEPGYLVKPGVKLLQEFRTVSHDNGHNRYIILVTDYDLSLYKVNFINPVVTCVAQKPFTDWNYVAIMKSPQCNNKPTNASYNHFDVCIIYQFFKITANPTEFYKITRHPAVVVGIILISIIIFCLMLLGCIQFTIWKKNLTVLQWIKQKLGREAMFNDQAETKMVTQPQVSGIELSTSQL